jgi:hypothetical protein
MIEILSIGGDGNGSQNADNRQNDEQFKESEAFPPSQA